MGVARALSQRNRQDLPRARQVLINKVNKAKVPHGCDQDDSLLGTLVQMLYERECLAFFVTKNKQATNIFEFTDLIWISQRYWGP